MLDSLVHVSRWVGEHPNRSRDCKHVFAETFVLLLAMQHIVSSGRDAAYTGCGAGDDLF
jgi:hypothetical protein